MGYYYSQLLWTVRNEHTEAPTYAIAELLQPAKRENRQKVRSCNLNGGRKRKRKIGARLKEQREYDRAETVH